MNTCKPDAALQQVTTTAAIYDIRTARQAGDIPRDAVANMVDNPREDGPKRLADYAVT